jgi:serine/threonine protein kinase
MVATSPGTFLERLSASQLLTAEQLAAARADGAGCDDKTLAESLIEQGLLTRFQARQLRAGATSFFIGKYVVVDCLGRGGNGIVYKARHRLMNQRFVALKTVDTRSLHHTQDSVERFRREIDIVAALDHPNVVRALDVLQTRGHLYLVLEYVPGQDLAKVVRERGRLPIGEAVDYAVQAARGLEYAHGQGIVHRDLKPANLLLTPDGVVKLSDLGLARTLKKTPDDDLTQKGLCLGTPEFMAPEQAEDANQADPRSDLYSLGATLFHLLTAELPLNGSSYLHRLQQLLTAPPKALAVARPEAPAELAALVDRLRLRDPNQRPVSAREVIALLQPFALKPEDPATWEAPRKAAVVLEVLRTQKAVAVCAKHRVPLELFERWQSAFLEGGQQALTDGPRPEDAAQEQIRELQRRLGAQAVELEALRKRLG